MGRKFPVGSFRKFGYTLHGCLLFQKYWKMLFNSSPWKLLEISENSNQNFSSNGKRSEFFGELASRQCKTNQIALYFRMSF